MPGGQWASRGAHGQEDLAELARNRSLAQDALNLLYIEPVDALDEERHPHVDMQEDFDLRDAVARFLLILSPDDRAVLILIFWFGFTPADVARLRQVSRSAMSQRLARIFRLGSVVLAEFAT
jgi:DNA-directed RNA polymerase specialized sigma24 family protein